MTRSARHGASPTAISREVMKENALLDRSSEQTDDRMSRARGPHSPRHARLEVTSRISMPSPGSRCRAIHARSRRRGRPGHDLEPFGRQPGNRQVALDAAPAVQHLRVHDAPVGHVDVVRADALEERARMRTRSWRSWSRRTTRRARGSPRARPRSRSTRLTGPSRPQRDAYAGSSFERNQFTLPACLLANSAPSSSRRA